MRNDTIQHVRRIQAVAGLAMLSLWTILISPATAEDWPEWAGKGRLGNWNETGILSEFPEGGLEFTWRKPIRSGYSAPIVADGRVFTMDWMLNPETRGMEGIERALCLDEETGETLWETEWAANYATIMASYATGPRAAPTVDGDRVYMAGAVGHILCLNVETGDVIWKRDTVEDFATNIPIFGTSFPPIIDGDLMITIVGGEDNALAVGFNKMTGEEVWRSIDTNGELCYSPPMIYEHAGVKQLLIWDINFLHSLNPQTGDVYWSIPFTVRSAMAIGNVQKSGSHLLASSFYSGSMLIKLDDDEPKAELVWAVKGKSEMPNKSEGLHSIITTPIIIGDYFYGACAYGQLRGLELMTSKRVWESDKFTRQGRWGTFFWVKNGDRYFVANDLGELIIMQFTPEGPIEIDRTMLIEPLTSAGFGPRKMFDDQVNWVHPAFANKHIIVRNDREIMRASLAAE